MTPLFRFGTFLGLLILAGSALMARGAFADHRPAAGPANRGKGGAPEPIDPATLKKRQRVFKSATSLRLVIYPPSVGGKASPPNAQDLVERIQARQPVEPHVSDVEAPVPLEDDRDSQKVLWAMAQRFSDFVQMNPPNGAYALYAQYIVDQIGTRPPKFRAVQFAVCGRNGELVVVDRQDDQTPDFRAISPLSSMDCDKLVVKRLERCLGRESRRAVAFPH